MAEAFKADLKKCESLFKECQKLSLENAQARSGVKGQRLRSRLTRLDKALDGLDAHIRRMLDDPAQHGTTSKEANAHSNRVQEIRVELESMQGLMRTQPAASDALGLGQGSSFDASAELVSSMQHGEVIQYQDQLIEGQNTMYILFKFCSNFGQILVFLKVWIFIDELFVTG